MIISHSTKPQKPAKGRADAQTQPDRHCSEMEHVFGGPVTAGAARSSDRLRLLHGKFSEHLWCTHCKRAFPNGMYRQMGDFRKCPYAGCDAHATVDALPWERVSSAHPDYPSAPVLGTLYAL